MQRDSKKTPFDMSLSLWSEDVMMQTIVRDLSVDVEHLQERGEPIINSKARSRRIAPKHYASVAHKKSSDENGVAAWLVDTLRCLDDHPTLPGLMRSGQVEALLWIATLGGDPQPPPVRVDPAFVQAATRLGVRILLEDYTRYDAGGVPQKTWLN